MPTPKPIVSKNPNGSDNPDAIIERMLTDQTFRMEVVKESHAWFFYYYFPHYIKYKMAEFHEAMFDLSEDQNIRTAVLVAFRGSAKSTLFTLSFPIWAILGTQQIKHILILSSTQQKAQLLLQHIKRELETNRVLQIDLGPFKEEKNGEWNTTSLYLTRYDAKITIGSVEQSIRGIRFKEHRPQLILIDDLESIESVKTKEGRDKIDQWLMGEVIPAGDESTRMFVVGNLLHNDSVMKRLQNRIESGSMSGTYLGIPFYNKNGSVAWPGKYPDQASIDAERTKGLSESAWRREFLLEIVPEEDQIVREEWIKYYDEIPEFESYTDYRFAVTGVDLAISEKETADYTTAVSVQVFGYGKERKIYVLPNPMNRRLDAPTAVEQVNTISRALGNGIPTKVYVEDVGYQRSFIQYLKEKGIPVDGVQIGGHDKRSRLQTAASLIQSGAVLFPRHGCEELLIQMLGFGVEKHDDLVDAFTLIILKLVADDGEIGRITIPSSYHIQSSPTKEEGNREADTEAILLAEARRTGDKSACDKYQAFILEQRKKYWDKEARMIYNRYQRRY